MAIIYVSSFSELKTAVEGAEATEIVVTEDITFLSGGIRVNTTRAALSIDFGGKTVTDYNDLSFGNALNIAATTSAVSVTVKNAVWLGRNYYGVVAVADGSTNTIINLENITYTGPQFVYNKSGITNISNCNVTLAQNGSSAAPQEFCEANRLSLAGNVTVNSGATGTAVLWFTVANSALTIKENALVKIDAPSTYFMYTDTSPVVTIERGADVQINTKNGLFYAAGTGSHIASSFMLGENAKFKSTQAASNGAPMFKCSTSFSVAKGAEFELYSPASGSSPLMYFGAIAAVSFNAPKRVVLYNNGGAVFKFASGSTAAPNTLSITAEMLRLWDTAKTPLTSAGGADDNPTVQYHKAGYTEDVSFVAKTTVSAVSSLETNLVSGDTGAPVTAADFKILTAKVVSFGALDLSVDPVMDISGEVSGRTQAGATVSAALNGKTETTTTQDGEFSLPIASVAVGDKLTVTSTLNFLQKVAQIVAIGSVSITSISPLKFCGVVLPTKTQTIRRIEAGWAIEVTDTRTSGGDWYLYASEANPLTSDGNTLKNTLVFEANGKAVPLSNTPILVYTGTWSTPPAKTKVVFADEAGLLLNFNDTTDYAKGKYTGTIGWQITLELLE